MADELPVLQVLARVDGDPGEGIEARGGAEEGLVPLGNIDAARVGVETRQYRVEDGGVGCRRGVPAGPCLGPHRRRARRDGHQYGFETHRESYVCLTYLT